MVKIAALKHPRASFSQNNNKSKKRRPSWVDVSDDEKDRKIARKQKSFAAGPSTSNGHSLNASRMNSKKKLKREDAAVLNSPVKSTRRLEVPPSIQAQREQLPIAQGKAVLIEEIRNNDVTVLVGETGSGKTTQVPQYLLESGLAGSGMIAITQPRRVAATSLASRVAVEQSTKLGQLVGYSVRFDEASSSSTRIKYVTDGMLIRELLSDGMLEKYSVIIVDEAHERTLRTDLLLANLKTIQKTRNGGEGGKGKGKEKAKNALKIVVMSATLDAEKFSRYFNKAKILYVQGRQHPVTIYHTSSSQADYVDAALRTFYQIHTDQPPGDVLIFLPGQEDIESLDKSIKLYADRLPKEAPGVAVYPMYAALPAGQQAAIFSPPPQGMRKCILATNIAETSITIPGIKYVIDTGKCKEKRYISRDTGSGFDTLLTRDITQSSAMQRAGRAGREGPGFCFRLYTEEAFKSMPLATEPEICRCSLTASVLQLKCLGQDLETLEFMDNPDEDSIKGALATLYTLGAIDDTKTLTKLGRDMALFPLEPSFARSLVASVEFGCTSEILDIISVLSSSSKLFFDSTDSREAAAEARRKFRHPSGDHLTILNIMRSYQEIMDTQAKIGRKEWCKKQFLNDRCLQEAMDIRAQLRTACEKLGVDWKTSCGDKEQPVLKCLLRGQVHQVAILQPDGSYRQLFGPSTIKIHPGSSLSDKKVPAIFYDELVYTTNIYARGVSSVYRAWIAELPLAKRQRTV